MAKRYKISKIIDKRRKHGRIEYRIRWTGFPPNQDTWEPAAEIQPVAYKLVREFHLHREEKPKTKSEESPASNSNSKVKSETKENEIEKQESKPRIAQTVAMQLIAQRKRQQNQRIFAKQRMRLTRAGGLQKCKTQMPIKSQQKVDQEVKPKAEVATTSASPAAQQKLKQKRNSTNIDRAVNYAAPATVKKDPSVKNSHQSLAVAAGSSTSPTAMTVASDSGCSSIASAACTPSVVRSSGSNSSISSSRSRSRVNGNDGSNENQSSVEQHVDTVVSETVLAVVEEIRKLKRKLLQSRVLQLVCRRLQLGSERVQATIDKMVLNGQLHRSLSSSDNAPTLYLVSPKQQKQSQQHQKQQQEQQQQRQKQQQQQELKMSSVKCLGYNIMQVARVGDHVIEIRFGSRHFNVAAMRELLTALRFAADDSECKIVRLASFNQSVFSLGVDLKSVLDAALHDECALTVTVTQLTDEMQRIVSLLAEFPKLVVATVTGACVGMATGLLALCDIIYAGSGAHFRLPYVQLQQPCEAATSYTLRYACGSALASEMLLAGRALTAAEAKERGLVSAVMPDHLADAEAAARCAALATHVTTDSVRVNKCLLHSQQRASIVQACQCECIALRAFWATQQARQLIENYLLNEHNLLL